MHIPHDLIPKEELELRQERCRNQVAALHPQAGGLLVFSRPAIYYLSGVMCSGLFWLPLAGKPLLMVRKGLERARMDSWPDACVAAFRSYGQLEDIAREHGAPLSPVLAAEQDGLPWSLADTLRRHLSEKTFVPGDLALDRARARKTDWELGLLREAGKRQMRCLEELLPKEISPGMSELEIAQRLHALYFAEGNCCISRMNNFGEEMVVGEVSVGDNGNYPGFYDGPLGCKGLHRSAHFLGAPDAIWLERSLLAIDTVFCFEAYNTDATRCYFAGCPEDIPHEARKAHDVCCAIEREAAEALRPGARPSALYRQAVRAARQAGFAEGFMGLGGNKVAFLGHSIGLNIDEWPAIAERFDEPLEKGMVMALEPKIGLPGFGMVGTENTWEVTDAGGVCLTGGPRDVICVE